MEILHKDYYWADTKERASKSFTCWNCNKNVASEKWYYIKQNNYGATQFWIYICPHCKYPTYVDLYWKFYPGFKYWEEVPYVPKEIYNLYDEARRCIKENCYNWAVMLCRKILMNFAVTEWAKEWLTFQKYVDYLDQEWFIPKKWKQRVDHIRKKWNEANHDIINMTENDAKDLIDFIGMLFKTNYEFPGKLPNNENILEN